MGIQALRPELAVKQLGERVVGRLARTRDVERDTPLRGPPVQVAGDGPGALDGFEDRHARLGVRAEVEGVDQLALEGREEALTWR